MKSAGHIHLMFVLKSMHKKMHTHLMQNKFIDKGVQSGFLLLFFVY